MEKKESDTGLLFPDNWYEEFREHSQAVPVHILNLKIGTELFPLLWPILKTREIEHKLTKIQLISCHILGGVNY